MNPQSKKIQDKVKQLEQVVQKLRIEAKQNLAKAQSCKGAQSQMYKNKAVMALNKKKQYENQMMGYMNQQMTIQRMQMTSQSIKNHQEMMGTMQQALKQQKKAMTTVNVDKMADLQDQMLDMKFEAQYMNDMMSRNYQLDVDEDELDDELAQFQREIAMDKKKTVNINTNNKNQINTNVNTNSYKNQDIESMLKGL